MANKIPPAEPYSNDRFDKLRLEFDAKLIALEAKLTALEGKIDGKLTIQSTKIDEKVPRHVMYWSVPLLLAILMGVFGYGFNLTSNLSNKFDLLKDRVLILETQKQETLSKR